MRFRLVQVGKEDPLFAPAIRQYQQRVAHYGQVERVWVAAAPLPPRGDRTAEERALGLEADRILSALSAGYRTVVLDVEGVPVTSLDLARRLEEWLREGRPGIDWVIGGAAGLHARVRQAGERISLSPLTLPHGMVPLLLMEQLYRAFRILRGEPYHR